MVSFWVWAAFVFTSYRYTPIIFFCPYNTSMRYLIKRDEMIHPRSWQISQAKRLFSYIHPTALLPTQHLSCYPPCKTISVASLGNALASSLGLVPAEQGKLRGVCHGLQRFNVPEMGETWGNQIWFLSPSRRQPDTTCSYRAIIVTQAGAARGRQEAWELNRRQTAARRGGSHFLQGPGPGNLPVGDS